MQQIDLNKVYQRIRKSSDTLESIPEGVDLSTAFEGKEKISKATLKYLRLFQSKGKSFFISWNWAAAFFSINWLLFKRAYVEGLFLLVAMAIGLFMIAGGMDMFSTAGINTVTVNWASEFLMYTFGIFFPGLFGNYLYIRSIHRKLYTNKNLRPSWLIGIFGTYIPIGILALVLGIAVSIYRSCGEEETYFPEEKDEIVQYSEK